MLIYAIVGIHA